MQGPPLHSLKGALPTTLLLTPWYPVALQDYFQISHKDPSCSNPVTVWVFPHTLQFPWDYMACGLGQKRISPRDVPWIGAIQWSIIPPPPKSCEATQGTNSQWPLTQHARRCSGSNCPCPVTYLIEVDHDIALRASAALHILQGQGEVDTTSVWDIEVVCVILVPFLDRCKYLVLICADDMHVLKIDTGRWGRRRVLQISLACVQRVWTLMRKTRIGTLAL